MTGGFKQEREYMAENKGWYKKAIIENLYDIEELSGIENIISFLKNNSIECDLITFPTGKQVIIFEDYIIDDFESPSIKHKNDWLSDIRDDQIDLFYNIPDFNEEFWENAPGYLYHATNEENYELIKEHGLLPKDETRGISNKWTPSAIFTSDNPDDISSYGDVVLAIDIGAMKKDSYMPVVSKEGPLEYSDYFDSIANKIGIEEYYHDEGYASEGISPSTVVIFGKIPNKYIRRIQ